MKKKPKPPAGLTPEARQLWTKTLAAWPIGAEQTLLCLLRSATGALMRLRSAEAALAELGGNGVFVDRWGQPRAHPLCGIIRDSSKQLREDLRSLCLDWEVLNQPLKMTRTWSPWSRRTGHEGKAQSASAAQSSRLARHHDDHVLFRRL